MDTTVKRNKTAAANVDIGRETRLELYRLQLELRYCEKRAYDLFLQNLIKGTSHLSLGQEAIAAAFGVAMGLSPLLQVRHMVARGSSADVSLPFLLVLLVGFVLWLAYGVALGNTALIVSNAVAITSYAVTTAAVLRLR